MSKAKVIPAKIINMCKDCPYCFYYENIMDNYYYCNKIDKELSRIDIIPDWCPLEDFDEDKLGVYSK